jgi:Flp pilus assembly protein TadG
MRRVWPDRQGNVAIIFAMALILLVGATGLGVDYGYLLREKSHADRAADSAALAAAHAAVSLMRESRADWQQQAEQNGDSAFGANFDGSAHALTSYTRVVRSGSRMEATTTYTMNYRTNLLKVFGINTIPVTNIARASTVVPTYVDIHLLVDLSASMGIGATVADQDRLTAATGCAIACHTSFPWEATNHTAARASGAVLRIDVVREAVRAFIANMDPALLSQDYVRISITGFSNVVIPLQAPTSNLQDLRRAADSIDLVANTSVGTNIYRAIEHVANAYPAGRTGDTPSDRKSYIAVISDGVENSLYPTGPFGTGPYTGAVFDPQFMQTFQGFDYNSFQRMQVLDVSVCGAAKNAGHILLTGHIEYLRPHGQPVSLQGLFDDIDSLVKPGSVLAFEQCASTPQNAFAARSSSEIAAMFEAIRREILLPQTVRLTN